MMKGLLQRYLQGEGALLQIGAVALFITIFSLLFLFDKSLRLDEVQSLWQTSHSMGGVLRIIAQDVHLPLYFLSLRAWETFFGATPFALRSFSLLFLLLCLPIFYALANRAHGRVAATVTLFLVGTSPFLLWYGSEGRMYTFLLFWTVLNLYAFFGLWTRGEKSAYWGLYAVTAILGGLTHYFFIFALIVQALFYLANREVFSRNAFRNFVVTALLVGAAQGIWLGYRLGVGQINADPYLLPPTSVDVFNVYSNFIFGFQSEWANTLVLSLWPIFVLMAFTLLKRHRGISSENTFLLMAAVLPVAIAFVVSLTLRPLFLSRYLIVALPPLYVLLARLLVVHKRWASVSVAGLLLVMQAALYSQALNPKVQLNENYREAAQYLERTTASSDLVVISAPFTRYPLEYYYDGQARLSTFPVWERYLDLPTIPPYSDESLAASLAGWREQYEHIYVLTSYDQGYEEDLRLYLDHNAERLHTEDFSPGLNLSVYRLRYL